MPTMWPSRPIYQFGGFLQAMATGIPFAPSALVCVVCRQHLCTAVRLRAPFPFLLAISFFAGFRIPHLLPHFL